MEQINANQPQECTKLHTEPLEKTAAAKIADFVDEKETIPIGSMVGTFAHPFTNSNTDVLISSYAHFTPPVMIVSEKRYGIKFNAVSGEKENNDSYKCLYYSTISGSIEENWFKRRELKLINDGDSRFFIENKDKGLDQLKKELVGEVAILTTVDLELKKRKISSDSDGLKEKFRVNNFLDFLPPLGTIIDIKVNDDYQKYHEKDGKISHRKSKLAVKLRWMNNTTFKYSEDYFPMVGLKVISKQGLTLEEYSKSILYYIKKDLTLENDSATSIRNLPLTFYDVIWNHYYYIYRFKNLFSGKLLGAKNSRTSIKKFEGNTELSIFQGNELEYKSALDFFNNSDKLNFEKKWFEIEYSDKNERYSKRIIYIKELIVEKESDMPKASEKDTGIIKANCLLRDGHIRHFNIRRIKGFREMPPEFKNNFVQEK